MRFALAGISHETNTFHSTPTEYESFEKNGMLLRGKEIEKLYDSPSTIGGFYNASKDYGFDLVPLLFATTGPLGTITSEAFEKLISEIIDLIENCNKTPILRNTLYTEFKNPKTLIPYS